MTDAGYLASFADGNEAHTYFVPATEPIAIKLRVVYIFSRRHDITLVNPPTPSGNWVIKSDEYTLTITPNIELESVQLAEHQALHKILCKPIALEQVALSQFSAVGEVNWDY